MTLRALALDAKKNSRLPCVWADGSGGTVGQSFGASSLRYGYAVNEPDASWCEM